MPQFEGRDDVEIQRRYYGANADQYERTHVHESDEHTFALQILIGLLEHLGVRSVLDVGSGTGRAVMAIKRDKPGIRVVGIEPVPELRAVGHRNGLASEELREGDVTALDYPDGAFDLACAFGVLHHVRRPERAVAEMLRVARKAVFVSDSNNFGQGRALARVLKQVLNAAGLWRAADFVKTRGRGYTVTEGDGLAYSYSVFNNYDQIRGACRHVRIFNTEDGGVNPYRSAGHVALLGIKA